MFKNNLWKNPVGWARNAVRHYWILIGMHVIVFCSQCFLVTVILHSVNEMLIRCMGHNFSMAPLAWGLLVPFFVMGIMMPVIYLYALKKTIKTVSE